MLYANVITVDRVGLCQNEIESLGKKIAEYDYCTRYDIAKASETLRKLSVMLEDAFAQGYDTCARNYRM